MPECEIEGCKEPKHSDHGNCRYCLACANENHKKHNSNWRRSNPGYQKQWKADFKTENGISYTTRKSRE